MLLCVWKKKTVIQGTSASNSSAGNTDKDPKSAVTGRGLKAILNGLGELWDQSQYENEYNLNQFLEKLNGWVLKATTAMYSAN